MIELEGAHMRPVRLTKLLSSACFYIAVITGVWSIQVTAQAPAAKVIGTVKSVSGSSIVVTLDNGTEATVSFPETARIIRAVPGQDVKSGAPIQVSDIQVGDRLSARGQAGDANSLTASVALVMKKSDITQKQQQEREEWRQGVGGLVKEVNAAAGTISIANSLAASGKPIVIHVSPQTDIRRYSPDSVKFEDAKPSTLDQIKAGDQVRARGTKNADGTEFTAKAIVSGAFRELAGTVVSTDATNNTLTITDLATKKPVMVKVGPDSMVRKLPQFVAMGIAMRLKGGGMPGAGTGMQGGAPQSGAAAGNSPAGGWQGRPGGQGAGHSATGAPGSPSGQGGFGGARGNGGPPDFQQMLARMPAVSISELNKGDAVMLVATEGSAGSGPTAITLLAGVEPILTAAPAGMNAAATVLSPWNLGQGGAGGGEGGPGQ
jgi:hypothetical protein